MLKAFHILLECYQGIGDGEFFAFFGHWKFYVVAGPDEGGDFFAVAPGGGLIARGEAGDADVNIFILFGYDGEASVVGQKADDPGFGAIVIESHVDKDAVIGFAALMFLSRPNRARSCRWAAQQPSDKAFDGVVSPTVGRGCAAKEAAFAIALVTRAVC